MRKFLALMLSVIMAVSAVSTATLAAKFTDVPASDETLTKAVELLASVGITTGTTETTFGTSEKVTRQQMATFVYRLMKAAKSVEGGENLSPFTDLVDPFYNYMISWANEEGIIKGTSATTFNPKGEIILQDAYTMLVRALGYEDYEIFDYPFGYIAKAEEIGLDAGLPSSVNYTTPLTRGNVAVLLYNAFYANLAKGITIYEIEFEPVMVPGTEENPQYKLVETGKVPVVTYTTVAEKIFGIERTVQRVVATPNYSLADPYTTKTYSKTADQVEEGITPITLACYDLEYKDTDNGLFEDVVFEDLGLEGTADDYFLIDLSIYYKKNGNEEPEIVSAIPLGERMKDLSKKQVVYERDANRCIGDASTSQDITQARFRAFTGKVTVNGIVSYLFDAPWSYLKPSKLEDKDDANITLLFLGATDRNPEDEDFVQDYNFVAHTDAVGRGAEEYSTLGTYGIYNKDKELLYTYVPSAMDERGGGLYSPQGIYNSMFTCLYDNDYEADAWDSNGDGKIDYLWPKPYTMAVISNDPGEPFIEIHKGDNDEGDSKQHLDILDRFGPIAYSSGEVAKIYTYGATVNKGVELVDGKFFTGYINGPANYISPATVVDFELQTMTYNRITGSGVTSENIYLDGTRYYIWQTSRKYFGMPGSDGARDTYYTNGAYYKVSDMTKTGANCNSSNFGLVNIGKTFNVFIAGGVPFYVTTSGNVINGSADYAVIYPNYGDRFAYTSSIGEVKDGNLQKTADYLDVMIGGEIISVPVKPQLDKELAENNTFTNSNGDDVCLAPLTPVQGNKTYSFNDYVGKLLTYTKSSDGRYVFKIAPLELNNDKSVLASEEKDVYYTFEADQDGDISSGFAKANGDLYQFVNAKSGTLNTTVAPSKYVRFAENTQVVIKTVEDDEEVFKIYNINNLPDFDESVDFVRIKYVVRNNPDSTTIEELVYLYGETDGEMTNGSFGNIFDYRIVKETLTTKVGDETVVYYDVYNPFTGKVEEEYEAFSDDTAAEINGIYALTTSGYIANHKQLGNIDKLGSMATSDIKDTETGLGLVKIAGYDEDYGYLEIEDEELYFQVDEDTVVTFLDLDKETIKKVSTSVLGSTSATYRCGDNKNMPLLAFIVSSEVKREDEYELAELIVIVRYNRLDD